MIGSKFPPGSVLISMSLLEWKCRLHCFSFKMAWMDVNFLCYILTELLVTGFFWVFLIVTVLTVSELLKVITTDQPSPGSYKTSAFCPCHCAASSHFPWLRNDSLSALLFPRVPFSNRF